VWRNLRDTLPSRLLFPSCFTLPYKCSHDPSIATVRFLGQGLQESRHAAPVWSETMMSADQSPRPPQPSRGLPCPRAPSTLCRGSSVVALEEGIGDS
jgi:hypothetical protein